MTEHAAQELSARLITKQWLPRTDPQVRRLIADESFRSDVLSRLESCGLCLLENPFAENVAVGLMRPMEDVVMGENAGYKSNNFGLAQDHLALLVILWALLIIPKRQKQIEANSIVEDEDQMSFFPEPRLVSFDAQHKPVVKEKALIADFSDKLGKKVRMTAGLTHLANLGFIRKHKEQITEGPMLDLVFDYKHLASRIINGAMGDLLSVSQEPPKGQEDENV